MKIIVDMMGGDNAPLAVLEGRCTGRQGVRRADHRRGQRGAGAQDGRGHNIPLDGIELVNCTEDIEMCDEPPAPSARRRILPSWWV